MPLLSSDYSPLLVIPIFAIAIAITVLNSRWMRKRSAAMLERHLRADGYHLVSRECRWLARGPFLWRTNKGQSVYRFIAADEANGSRREGWARVGGAVLGLWSDRVAIRWDDEPQDRGGPGFPVVMPEEPQRSNR